MKSETTAAHQAVRASDACRRIVMSDKTNRMESVYLSEFHALFRSVWYLFAGIGGDREDILNDIRLSAVRVVMVCNDVYFGTGSYPEIVKRGESPLVENAYIYDPGDKDSDRVVQFISNGKQVDIVMHAVTLMMRRYLTADYYESVREHVTPRIQAFIEHELPTLVRDPFIVPMSVKRGWRGNKGLTVDGVKTHEGTAIAQSLDEHLDALSGPAPGRYLRVRAQRTMSGLLHLFTFDGYKAYGGGNTNKGFQQAMTIILNVIDDYADKDDDFWSRPLAILETGKDIAELQHEYREAFERLKDYKRQGTSHKRKAHTAYITAKEEKAFDVFLNALHGEAARSSDILASESFSGGPVKRKVGKTGQRSVPTTRAPDSSVDVHVGKCDTDAILNDLWKECMRDVGKAAARFDRAGVTEAEEKADAVEEVIVLRRMIAQEISDLREKARNLEEKANSATEDILKKFGNSPMPGDALTVEQKT